jgi:hypothetical protein
MSAGNFLSAPPVEASDMKEASTMRKALALALLALAVAFAAACSSGDEEGASPPQGAATGAAEDDQGAGSARTAGGVPVSNDVPAAKALPAIGPRIIQTASVRLSLQRGRFQEAVDEARSVVAGLGGFVVSSSASQGTGRRLVSGTLVVRVPGRSYAQAMRRLAEIGRVEAREESGQDVSQEFVDLESRARHLEAVERQLLELLDRAESVASALAVQSRLNEVQLDLEQTRGRLRFLDDQVSFATISLALHERGPVPAAKDDGGWGIVDAWETAGHGFVAVVGWIFIALATAAPILVLLALAALLGRAALRRRIGPVWRARLKSD